MLVFPTSIFTLQWNIGFKLVSHQTIYHRFERLRNTKIGGKNGEKIGESKGANPQRVSTEIIIEIKQLNSG